MSRHSLEWHAHEVTALLTADEVAVSNLPSQEQATDNCMRLPMTAQNQRYINCVGNTTPHNMYPVISSTAGVVVGESPV